jgi:hypothetical protein
MGEPTTQWGGLEHLDGASSDRFTHIYPSSIKMPGEFENYRLTFSSVQDHTDKYFEKMEGQQLRMF